MDCIVCKGTGKTNLKVRSVTVKGTTDETVVIGCIWCTDGQMSEEQKQEHDDYVNAWCRCGNPSGNRIVESRGYTLDVICCDCEKYLQIG